MTRRFLIKKHPHVITATEVRVVKSQGVLDPIFRFQSVQELTDYFASLGASAAALEAIPSSIEATGIASLVFFQKAE
jgi:hypothetical protein